MEPNQQQERQCTCQLCVPDLKTLDPETLSFQPKTPRPAHKLARNRIIDQPRFKLPATRCN